MPTARTCHCAVGLIFGRFHQAIVGYILSFVDDMPLLIVGLLLLILYMYIDVYISNILG